MSTIHTVKRMKYSHNINMNMTLVKVSCCFSVLFSRRIQGCKVLVWDFIQRNCHVRTLFSHFHPLICTEKLNSRHCFHILRPIYIFDILHSYAEPFYFVKYGSSNISSIITSNNLFCFMSFNNLQYWNFYTVLVLI